ncbi:MAG: hypothetical protein COZ80_03455 [Ignavibacteria bacterium CG_4_8_14_3_um_filter_37_9]|nr:hypothetical protein [Ignavibacteria bacterium]OIO19705.1 MAG: hypothetical protein AUJ54_06230 [Ignavibacteria bacterium CG1_02_37_35]PIS45492.1 MAG: hypothetical protein COT22_05010 [Ignavibacteria bacterium CG08_land_8_20_14_0_20_37_9]PIW99811.1 MAG: hypothetical protein COZ80_03455 [Ignavibacteria bacterium CG_4_8_14_3_um_filter_37_9]PIX95434.1 MAG: hypothetical protein COZ25_00485 [Ignavibacteria bacterium CG_4_10_14_3_um_filter_37_18]PJC60792.1 MAG: hypothetical protein CO025_02145 [I
MKTGCLIKGLIASTIFFAVIFYVATNKMDDYIVNPIKKFSVNYMTKDLKDELRFVKATPEKDSLFVHLNSFTKDITKMKTVNLNTVNDLVDSIKQYLDDSLVTQKDLENIKVIIEAELKNERSKKN